MPAQATASLGLTSRNECVQLLVSSRVTSDLVFRTQDAWALSRVDNTALRARIAPAWGMSCQLQGGVPTRLPVGCCSGPGDSSFCLAGHMLVQNSSEAQTLSSLAQTPGPERLGMGKYRAGIHRTVSTSKEVCSCQIVLLRLH